MTQATSSENLFANVLQAKQQDAVTNPDSGTAADAGTAADEGDTETGNDAEAPKPNELDMLKARARLMGLKISNNIGLETLRERIRAKLEGEETGNSTETEEGEEKNAPETEAPQQSGVSLAEIDIASLEQLLSQARAAQGKSEVGVNANYDAKAPVASTPVSQRQKMVREQMRLVRCRITNLNPSKKDLPGEIFTFANRILGAVRKYVPYGEATENGYHVPFCIFTQLKEREFVSIKTRKDSRGRTIVETGMAREFAIEELPPLTEIELARLAAAQAAANGMD